MGREGRRENKKCWQGCGLGKLKLKSSVRFSAYKKADIIKK